MPSNQTWLQLGLNVIGGLLAGIATILWVELRSRTRRWKFKQIFGRAIYEVGFALVYEEMVLGDTTEPFPYRRPGGDSTSGFSITRPIPIASVRSISYLSSAVGVLGGRAPVLRSDIETQSLLDFDFVCFGGPRSNLMTASVEENEGNRSAKFDHPQRHILSLQDNSILAQTEAHCDYGLILKIHPAQFPKRVWISCAGFGEWGTSGAAWFLAHKWEEIRRIAHAEPFAAIIRVSPGKDQSAQLMRVICRTTDVHKTV
jgi:hypothetical protein